MRNSLRAGVTRAAGVTGAVVALAVRLVLGLVLDTTVACSDGSDNAAAPDTGRDAGSTSPDAGFDATTNVDDGSPGEGDAGVTATDGDVPPFDAGSGDGSRDYSTDTALFLGASRCADSGLQLCEDFENGTLDKTVWTTLGVPPVIDTAQHARGSHALRIAMNTNGQSAIRESKTFPAAGDTYYGRMFVYFKSLPTPPGMSYAHWTIVAASGTGVPGEIRVSGQLQNGKNLFGVGTDNRTDGGSGDWTSSDKDPDGSPSAVPVGKWMCLEWLHKGDTNETAFWWDGVPHPSLSTTASKNGGNGKPYDLPQFTNVWFGWQEYQDDDAGEPFDLWVDEIAIDPHRIGCVL